MSLKLYFLRHGETTFSQSGGYCGDLDVELTAAGQQMAQEFATAYQSLNWTAIYTSPMRRTQATVAPLCAATGLEMQLREGLKEIRYGQWEGLTSDEIKVKFPTDYQNWLTEPAWNPPTGGETAVQVASRASLVLTEIEQKHANGNVLIVSHKGTIRIMLCSLLGIDLGRYRDRITALAASLSIVKFDVHGPLLEVLGDRSYMSEALRNLPGT